MIKAVALSKRYGSFEAVHDVSFTAESGQVLGLLGPNGAGKTTVLKVLTCFHFPSAGEAKVDGISVLEDPVEVKKRVGYLPENAPLYGDLTVDEYLAFVADARLMDKSTRAGRIDRVLGECGLSGVRSRRIETLSKGYRQRVGLAQAIVHDPSVLILDEPTSGLDPNQILEIRELVRRLGESKTVILSTHILQEVEAVCSRVLILNEGRIAAQGRPEEIAATLKGGESWDLTLLGADGRTVAEKLKALGGLVSASEPAADADGTVSVTLSFGSSAASVAAGERIFDWAVASSIKIVALGRRRVSLEDIFVKLTHEGDHL